MVDHQLMQDKAAQSLVRAVRRSTRSLYEAGRVMRFLRTHCFCPGLRSEAASYFATGERVLEIGCGDGKNFPYLMQRLGPTGMLYAIDFSSAMVADACRCVKRYHWHNVEVTHIDASMYAPKEQLDGVLFSFSYQTLPNRKQLLEGLLPKLKRGGKIVVADAKLPDSASALSPWMLMFAARSFGSDPAAAYAWVELSRELKLQGSLRRHLFDTHYTFCIRLP